MTRPSRHDIRAVRAVLYKRDRLRKIQADMHSVEVLLNLAGPEPGAPRWVVESTGQVGSGVRLASERARRLAKTLRTIGAEIAELDIPDADQKVLRKVLNTDAALWDLRAKVWSDPDAPDETAVNAEFRTILTQGRAAVRKASPYLRKADEISDLLETRS